jgi:hypothetical protein
MTMVVPRSRTVALLLAVLAFTIVRPAAAAADVPDRVEIVGDSLTRAAQDLFPADWRVRARNGRALFESMKTIGTARAASPECLVVALGSNDVGQHRSRIQMLHDLDQVDGILAGVGCVAWTTVKVRGVSPVYGRDWAQYARTWNTLLRDHVEGTVLDWNAIARSHPGYFLGDGLHMSGAGRAAYAHFLQRGVAPA